MKKHLLLLMLFAGSILVFTSCKKDKDVATLEGTWTLTSYKLLTYENDKLIDTEQETPGPDDPVNYFSFSGNQWIRYQGEERPAFEEDQTFVYSNSMLTLYDKDELVIEVKVKTLNGRTLVMSQEQIDNVDGVIIRKELDYIFEKR